MPETALSGRVLADFAELGIVPGVRPFVAGRGRGDFRGHSGLGFRRPSTEAILAPTPLECQLTARSCRNLNAAPNHLRLVATMSVTAGRGYRAASLWRFCQRRRSPVTVPTSAALAPRRRVGIPSRTLQGAMWRDRCLADARFETDF